MGPQGNKGNRL